MNKNIKTSDEHDFKIVKTAYGVVYRPDVPHYVIQREPENMR